MNRHLVALALVICANAASAEIYKCTGPNGDVRFTSNASQCPNAQPHAPKEDAVLRAEKARPLVSARPGALTRPARAPAKPADASAGSESLWRQKKAEAESKLRELEMQVEYVSRAIKWCNRGNTLWTEDDATGLRKDISCSEVDGEYAALLQQKQEVEQYLAEGLEEECRRAGCLPGWLR